MFGQGRSTITCLCSDTSNNDDTNNTTNTDNNNISSSSISGGGGGSEGTNSSGNVKSGMCKGYFTDTMVKMCLPEAVYIKYTGKRVDLWRIVYAAEGYMSALMCMSICMYILLHCILLFHALYMLYSCIHYIHYYYILYYAVHV